MAVRFNQSARPSAARSRQVDSEAAPKEVKLKGTVTLTPKPRAEPGKPVSGSARDTLSIQVKGKRVLVERMDGNPFTLDAKERALIGKSVELKGFFITPNRFRFTEATASAGSPRR